MKLYEKIFLISIVLFSIGFFYIKVFSPILRILDIVTVFLVLFGLLAYYLFGKKKIKISKTFSIPILLIIIGALLSSFPSYYYHNQPILISLYQQRHIYALAFYFLLFYLVPKKEWLINFIFIMALSAGIFFIIQYVLYPTLITEAKVFVQRGTIRINLPGRFFMFLGFFLGIDRFFTRYDYKYGFLALLLFIVAILSGFRSTVALYVLLSAGFILFSRRVNNKLLLTLTALIFFAAGIFAFEGIVNEMVESAKREGGQGGDYIRYRAGEYLLGLNHNNPAAFIFGNGSPSVKSPYGIKISSISFAYGYYLSDIGIFGFYFKYGLIASLSVLWILLKVILSKMSNVIFFIKLFFIYQLLTISNTVPAFDSLSAIIIICMNLYIYDVTKEKYADI